MNTQKEEKKIEEQKREEFVERFALFARYITGRSRR